MKSFCSLNFYQLDRLETFVFSIMKMHTYLKSSCLRLLSIKKSRSTNLIAIEVFVNPSSELK